MILNWLKWGSIAAVAIAGALVIIGAIVGPQNASKTAVAAKETAIKSETPKPISIEDRIRAIAKSGIDEFGMGDVTYEGIQTAAYYDPDAAAPQPTGMWDGPIEKAPKGAVDFFVNYHLNDTPTSDGSEAAFAAGLFQKILRVSPLVWRVTIDFHSPQKDDYGRTNEIVFVGYTMHRPTFRKIDWRGFDANTLCAFLRNEEAADIAQDGDPKGGDGCNLLRSVAALGIDGVEDK